MSRAQLMDKYALKKIPLHEFIKAKEKTKEVMKGMESVKKSKEMYRERQLPMDKLDEAVFKWHTQEITYLSV
ncbi:hypothetical protein Pmani_001217 [Petrolisthes manimaculis]|uniref:Uncharacterized protein n=1 Tax=Petrolisthes manimaculis TaxID=1843537 RepID=A0AAE1QNJ8_9EUCA|nr:hypothetical protein Pmani_001217 [Petrolisthes manimaculis]